MIIFLYGKDTFRSRTQLKKMIEKFKVDRDPQGLNIAKIDCDPTSPSGLRRARKEGGGGIMEEVLAIPFLAEKRMVVLENLLISKNKDLMQDLLKRIEEKNLPETNIIIFWEGTDSFKTKDAKTLFGRLQKEKYAQKFDEFKGVKLSAWIANEIKERNGKIEKSALEYLGDHVGGDMWRLDSLIDQLIAFKNSEEIAIEDAQLFLDEKQDDNIFNLVDAIVGKQPKQVFGMIKEQYRQGKDAGYIFAMILRQFRILLELRDLFEREDNMKSDQVAKQLGLHPFVVKKSLPLVRRYTMDELKSIYRQLLDIDIETKTGGGEQSMLLDVFVGRVCVG